MRRLDYRYHSGKRKLRELQEKFSALRFGWWDLSRDTTQTLSRPRKRTKRADDKIIRSVVEEIVMRKRPSEMSTDERRIYNRVKQREVRKRIRETNPEKYKELLASNLARQKKYFKKLSTDGKLQDYRREVMQKYRLNLRKKREFTRLALQQK
jgi:hypothetical protein